MSNRSNELTRRRVIGGFVTVGVASAAAGAGTMAYFSDSASSTGNAVQSGTLDLTLDGTDSTVQFLSETAIEPGDSGTATLDVRNAGSIPGYLDIEVASTTNYENGLQGNENAVDSSGGDPGAGNGELQNHLELAAGFQNGPTLWSGYAVMASEVTPGTVYDLDYQLSAGTMDTFELDWRLPSDTGNEAQSDSVEFALTFRLDQQTDSGL